MILLYFYAFLWYFPGLALSLGRYEGAYQHTELVPLLTSITFAFDFELYCLLRRVHTTGLLPSVKTRSQISKTLMNVINLKFELCTRHG